MTAADICETPTLDDPSTDPYLSPYHPSTKAHPVKAGVAKPRVLASSATPD
jgi:hypothetical protein